MGNTGSRPQNKTGKRVVAQKLNTAQKTNVLSLTEHGLEEIPEQVYQLTSLRTLDVSKNKIQNLGKISQLTELKSLNCDENALATSSLSQISKLSKLQTLSLGKNRLENSANQTFPSLPPKIKILKVHGNSFSSIPRQICDPTLPLEKLDLSCNNLAVIPPEICNLAATLTELILDKNAIVSLPIEVGQLIKLKVLSLKNNYIEVKSTKFSESNPQPIPAALFENTPLIDLNLHGNRLTSTQINEFEGFGAFLERRKKVKTKNLYGGALVDMSLCGLK
mmetsp:Transcript_23517/g.50964  ORF Transcript_23517/g.50964 Transcript_23517/m.50964 type:complete len:278 (-) Transcript_23517:51-884(-)